MKDRESTNILENGAIRYGIYDESGTLVRYEYIRLEDEPTVEGSIYNRSSVLPDAVCNALGINAETAEPKDAFAALCDRINKNPSSTFERYMIGGML